MNVFHNFTCIYHDFDGTVIKQKLGDNIVTVTNNVLHTFLKIFAVVKFLPCFPIIADTGKLIKNFCIMKGTFSTRVLPLSVNFFLYINMGTACQLLDLLDLIKIFKMAAELCNRVLFHCIFEGLRARVV